MKKLSNPTWNKGYDAYFDGTPRGQNPHDQTLDENLFELWEEGWDAADSDDDSD